MVYEVDPRILEPNFDPDRLFVVDMTTDGFQPDMPNDLMIQEKEEIGGKIKGGVVVVTARNAPA